MDLTGIIALSTGFLSFFTPCVLPLIPSYLIFISGISIDTCADFSASRFRGKMLLHAVLFILGFSSIFVALGLSSSFIGQVLSSYQSYIVKIGGILLIIIGLFSLDIIKIPLFQRQKMIQLNTRPIGILGAFVIGITFALAWTPCLGPILSSILILASTTETVWQGGYLLGMYSLGFAIPFVVSSLIFNQLIGLLKNYGHIVMYTMKVMGVLLIFIGVLLITSYFNTVSRWIQGFF